MLNNNKGRFLSHSPHKGWNAAAVEKIWVSILYQVTDTQAIRWHRKQYAWDFFAGSCRRRTSHGSRHPDW